MNADVSSPEEQQRASLNGPVSSLIRSAQLSHSATMAESSVIQSSASSNSTGKAVTDEERCGQFMSLWRPIMCRNQMYRSHDLSSSGSTAAYLSSLVQQQQETVKHQTCPTTNTNTKIRSDSASNVTNSKSIPVHCIVMSTSTPYYLADTAAHGGPGDGCKSAGANAGDVLSGDRLADHKDTVDMDSYAIIPASTLFSHIVPTVLRKLGYSDDSIFNATGWLIMKNWRPLSLSLIAASDADTVGTILGELTTVATLKIYIRRNANSVHSEMKNKVLRWLLAHSQHLISNSRFPLDEKWQQKVVRGERPSTPSPETRRQFDTWFQQEMSLRTTHSLSLSGPMNAGRHPADSASKNAGPGSPTLHLSDQHPIDLISHGHAGFPPRVRMRTTFDPEQELPRLQRWFAENQHPTRFQLQLFVQELNALDSRRGRKPLDVSNLVYWFKNARAAYKRAEIRNQSGGSNVEGDWNGCASSLTANDDNDSSDENPRIDQDAVEDEEDEEEDEADGGASSVSDRSGSVHAFENRPLKLEPDLRIDEGDEHDAEERRNDSQVAAEDEDDGAGSSVDSESEENDNDYAENLSMSKSNDRDPSESDKSGEPPPDSRSGPGGTASSSHAGGGTDCHYRIGDYGGFPLGLGHAQNVLGPHGLVYMTSPYLQGLGSSMGLPVGVGMGSGPGGRGMSLDPLSLTGATSGSGNCADDRRKRNRTFIDPVTEVPRLEHWFSLNTHPSHSLVLRYTEELNRQPYRQKFPKLEPKNVQFWFKNRRAKCKRLKLSL